MTAMRETVTAGEVAAELKRRGIGSDEKVTLTIDINVFVSAALKDKSVPALPLRIAALIDRAAADWVRNLMAAAEAVTITERIAACRDATDDKFLEVAVNGKADMIVSGDADLLVLNPFRGIPIVPPSAFVQGSARTPPD